MENAIMENKMKEKNTIEEEEAEEEEEANSNSNSEEPAELIPETPLVLKNASFFVYLLCTLDEKSTYIGATVDVHRRLRQHNGEIKGGAKYTTRKGPAQWKRILYVSGFPTWNDALKFEWRWKQLGRKKAGLMTIDAKRIDTKINMQFIHGRGLSANGVIYKRLCNLSKLLSLEKPTQTATPYLNWPSPPILHYE